MNGTGFKIETVYVHVKDLIPYANNANDHPPEQIAQIKASIIEFGPLDPPIIDEDNMIMAGHGRRQAYLELEWEPALQCTKVSGMSEAQKKAFILAHNQIARNSKTDPAKLAIELERLTELGFDLDLTGYSPIQVEDILSAAEEALENTKNGGDGEGSGKIERPGAGILAERFGIPPFTVLNAREGWWQARKKAWIALGIKSEEGRGASPGGSPMPSASYGDDGARGNGAGKAILFNKSQAGLSAIMKQKGQEKGQSANKGGLTFNTSLHPYDGKTAPDGFESGTSIFDPVLTELAYRWFSPDGGVILDPFAGGSVRGVVAAVCGRKYHGVDLRAEQIQANAAQWQAISGQVGNSKPQDFQPELTPVEKHNGFWVKRDDTYSVAGARGGKVRTCWILSQGAKGLVTAGSRQSPQVNIVAHIAKALGIPCRVHTPEGELSPEVQQAKELGAEVFQHKAGYNSVIIKRARDDAQKMGYTEIPFGMECQEAVKQTRKQVANLPDDITRIVMPVGSGMSLAGVLWGLKDAKRKIPVIGVVVGSDPVPRLKEYAPKGWEKMVSLVKSSLDYHDSAPDQYLGDLLLDPIYEAKCLPFLEVGDLMWCVGIRNSEIEKQAETAKTLAAGKPDPTWYVGDSRDLLTIAPHVRADFVFSCPPYGDLEQYSDNPADLSNLNEYREFLAAYRTIVHEACVLLKDDRFAAFVVGDYRDKNGMYRNFVSETIKAFLDAGLFLYNEAILVTAVGSLPIRVGKQFTASRKLGKTHQNVLVFCKGDPVKATEACGIVEFGDITEPEASEDAEHAD